VQTESAGNPLPLSFGWTWMARCLNSMPPNRCVCVCGAQQDSQQGPLGRGTLVGVPCAGACADCIWFVSDLCPASSCCRVGCIPVRCRLRT
jgi:hypothetical protein